MINVKKLPIRITPSSARMLIRPFIPGSKSKIDHILFRIISLPKEEQEKILANIYENINVPTDMVKSIFIRNFDNVKSCIPTNSDMTDFQREFIGAYFTQQYSLESTALFNPSIVPHPVQDKEAVTKFIISLRAIGEGHISSITFMEGEIDKSFNIKVYNNSPVIQEPVRKEHHYDKQMFMRKANELGILSERNTIIFDELQDHFSFEELEQAISRAKKSNMFVNKSELKNSLNNIKTLALSNFSLKFLTDDLSARAIYPASPSQSNGLEDARFVKFTEEDGTSKYYATFTAYDGKTVMPELLETENFVEFRISTMNGPAVKNKGMALFPRRINGLYMMLGRQDTESISIMASDNPYFWYDYKPLVKPTYRWEFVQLGNCGSPIEIEEGWLVLTHGVGAVRSYSLGAILLDKNEPWRVIGRLKEPLLEPTKEERTGYVPNVLYSCGGMVIDRTLILPYAIGDVITTFALINIDELVKEMAC